MTDQSSNGRDSVSALFVSVGALVSQYREALALNDTAHLALLDRSAGALIQQLGLLRALQHDPEAALETAMHALAAKETNASVAMLLSRVVETAAVELRLVTASAPVAAYDGQGRGHLHRLRASAGLAEK